MGRIRTLAFKQRYLLRTGAAAYRMTKPRVLAQQLINSGYAIAHLHLNNKRTAFLVHRLVALAFCPGARSGSEVNHKSGVKADNRAVNLEWVSRTENHLHAVRIGLRTDAQPVECPRTGVRYASISQAARATRQRAATVRTTFIKRTRNVHG